MLVGLFLLDGLLSLLEDELKEHNSQGGTSKWEDIVDPDLTLPGEDSIEEHAHRISESNCWVEGSWVLDGTKRCCPSQRNEISGGNDEGCDCIIIRELGLFLGLGQVKEDQDCSCHRLNGHGLEDQFISIRVLINTNFWLSKEPGISQKTSEKTSCDLEENVGNSQDS